MTAETPVAPWYRQPWFWFLTIAPLAAITWSMTMLVVAVNMEDSMVSDDYSKEGRGINLELARDDKAAELELEADIQFDGRQLSLNLTSTEDFPYLVLNLFHPTLDKYDRVVQFSRESIGHYTARMNEDIDGRWYYDLRGPTNEWRLKGEAWLPAEKGLKLKAGLVRG
ncbi:FixH family protein [Marinobacter gelidimuriae]|uniref:FixH family protein n=1 Tax=Marinobacter gelidimuriae TaxID=2739064 RepID=UPI000373E482|nr:FixH family protein [Marinobacter gelidimuriae]